MSGSQVIESIRRHHADALQLQSRKFRDPSSRAVSLYRMPLPTCVCKKGYPVGKGHPKTEAEMDEQLLREAKGGKDVDNQ